MGKWRRRGLSVDRADAVAVALGLHPVEVWPEWYALTDADEAA